MRNGIVEFPADGTAVDISVGTGHSCAVLDNGQMVCFGFNSADQLGNEATKLVAGSPVLVNLPAGRIALMPLDP